MGRRTPAVERSLDILELLLDGRETITAPDVVAVLGLPRTTAHELLHTLVNRGYLERHPAATGSYRLGIQLLRLGTAYATNVDLVSTGREVAQTVSRQSDETVHLGVLDGTHVIYVAKVDSTRQVRMVSAEGVRLPAHCTAVGKALLAYLDADELRRRIDGDGGLTALTAHSITDVSVLLDQLKEIRSSGLATEICESSVDVGCVAAPVRDKTGEVVAALSVSVPLHRFDEVRRPELSTLIKDGAALLSDRLGAPS